LRQCQSTAPPTFKPIAHLYRSQVYQLADHLGVPQEIRPPLLMDDAVRL